MRHVHRPIPSETRDRVFIGGLNVDRPNPAAHGGITRVERCRCGAVRTSNRNGRHVERGVWVHDVGGGRVTGLVRGAD